MLYKVFNTKAFLYSNVIFYRNYNNKNNNTFYNLYIHKEYNKEFNTITCCQIVAILAPFSEILLYNY